MLAPLTTSFTVKGNGITVLKSIQKSYEKLRQTFLKGEQSIKSSFSNIGKVISGFGRKVKSGFSKIGNGFKTLRVRADDFLSNVQKKGDGVISTMKKLAFAIGGGFLVQKAFSGAMETEMTRTALTSMTGKNRANELMNYGVNFANITPYETSEVMDAVKKLELRGLNPQEYLEPIGNMAAMLGKPLNQAVEAIIKATVGEFEMLKEFSISKNMLMNMMPNVFNKSGSVTNQKKMFNGLMEYVEKRYKGGMLALSKTTKGLLSTVKGISSSFLNMLMSGSMTGEIVEGSPLDLFRNQILIPLADNLVKWQEDGTFTKWSESFSSGVRKIANILRDSYDFFIEYKDEIIAIGSGFLATKLAIGGFIKIASGLQTISSSITVFKELGLLLGITTPQISAIIIGIGLLTSAFVWLYKKSEPFRTFTKGLLDIFSVWLEVIKEIFDVILKLGSSIKDLFGFGGNILESASGALTGQINYENYYEGNEPILQDDITDKSVKTVSNNISINVSGTSDPITIAKQIKKELEKRKIKEGE